MEHDVSQRGILDDFIIDSQENNVMDEWSERFGVSTNTLRMAIGEAGSKVKQLREWLHRNGYIKAID